MSLKNKNEEFGKFQISINNNAYISVDFEGYIDKKILNDSFSAVIQHPQFTFNMNACYDYSHANSALDMVEIEEHAQLVGSLLSKRGSTYKLAMVSSDSLNQTLLSIYRLLLAKTSIDVEVFADKLDAIKWISQSD